MRIRPLWLVLAFLLLIPGAADAHTHRWDLYFGPSYAHASHLTGFQVTFGLPLPVQNPIVHRFSVVLDTSVHTGLHDDGELRRSLIGAGLRFTPHDETERHLMSIQVIVGKTWDNTLSLDESGWGATTGAIYEFLLDRDTPGEGWAFRAQADGVFSEVDKFVRLSTGFAYHFR
jgi:hypothetical protein